MSGPYIKRVLEQELTDTRVRLELTAAQRDGALEAVRELVRIVRAERNAFLWPEQQATLRAAQALLAEHGRSVEGET